MLPFLKNKQEGAMSSPAEVLKREPDEGSESYEMLDAVAEDILSAIERKDKGSLKAALESLVDHIQTLDAEQDEQLTNKEV